MFITHTYDADELLVKLKMFAMRYELKRLLVLFAYTQVQQLMKLKLLIIHPFSHFFFYSLFLFHFPAQREKAVQKLCLFSIKLCKYRVFNTSEMNFLGMERKKLF